MCRWLKIHMILFSEPVNSVVMVDRTGVLIRIQVSLQCGNVASRYGVIGGQYLFGGDQVGRAEGPFNRGLLPSLCLLKVDQFMMLRFHKKFRGGNLY